MTPTVGRIVYYYKAETAVQEDGLGGGSRRLDWMPYQKEQAVGVTEEAPPDEPTPTKKSKK